MRSEVNTVEVAPISIRRSEAVSSAPPESHSVRTRRPERLLELPQHRTAVERPYYNESLVAALRFGFKVVQTSPQLATFLARKMFFAPRRKALSPLRLSGLKVDSLIVKGKRIVTYEIGEGPAILIVHGWESSVSRLKPLIEQTVAAGYKVVSFDLAGHGASEGKDTDPIEATQAIEQLGKRHGRFHAAFAHSFGAVCLANALRVGVEVDRVVLFSAPSSVWTIIDTYSRFLQLSDVVNLKLRHQITQRFLPYTVDEHLDIGKNLRVAALPTLVVHDLNDQTVPFAEAREIEQAYPDAQVLATKGSGHNRLPRTAPVIAECLNFLRQ